VSARRHVCFEHPEMPGVRIKGDPEMGPKSVAALKEIVKVARALAKKKARLK